MTEGLLEPVDKPAAKVNELPPQMVRDYGIVSYSLGTNLVFRKDKFPTGGPQSWADFWDVASFRGRAAWAITPSPVSPSPSLPTASRRTSFTRWTSIVRSAR